LVEIDFVVDPLVNSGSRELLHDNEPVVEVRVALTIRKFCLEIGVLLLDSRIANTLASGYPGRVFLLR
jgi:hypothetical protein